MAAALPEANSRERDEIEALSRTFSDVGFDVQLSTNGPSWIAALLRQQTAIPTSAPQAAGPTALEAMRSAWRLYLSVPSLSSLDPPRLSVAELLASWIEELAAARRRAKARNARALESLAFHLSDPALLGVERARDLERLMPAFETRTFPRAETQQLLLRHRSTAIDAHDALLVALVRGETRPSG